MYSRWIAQAKEARLDWEDRGDDEDCSDFSGGALQVFEDAGGVRAMRNCVQDALGHGLSDKSQLYYEAGDLSSEMETIFSEIRSRGVAAEMVLKKKAAVEIARRRSKSMDKSLLSTSWVRIFDWRDREWYYLNTFVTYRVVGYKDFS